MAADPPELPVLRFPSVSPLKTGRFPHQAYRPICDCALGQPKETRNYAGHITGPPSCSACGRRYALDIELMK